MKRRGIFSILVAVVLVATLVIFLVSFRVRLNESGIVFTFGEVARAANEPGLYWKLPYPVQTVQSYDRRINVLEGKFHEPYTADRKNIILTVALGWSIEDPVKFYESVRTRAKAEEHLEGLVRSKANAVVGRYKFGQFVSTDEKKLAFEDIEKDIRAGVESTAEGRYGIQTHFVLITRLGLPEKVTERVFARMKAERERIATKYRSEGKSEGDKIRARAEQQRSDFLSKAEAEAKRLRGQGETAVAPYFDVFKKSPELENFLFYLDWLPKLKERATYLLTTDTPPWILLSPDFKIPNPLKGKKAPPSKANPSKK